MKLEKAIDARCNAARPDYEFHKKIVGILHNVFLEDVYKVVSSAIKILWQSPLGIYKLGDGGLRVHRELFEEIRLCQGMY